MILIIDSKVAAIKQGSTFDYVSENRLFTDSDEYSMNIELPLDCKENFEIFGYITRKDCEHQQIYYEAELQDRSFHSVGAVVITSITESSVKVQFIAGRSYRNFYPKFDKLKVNELELGDVPSWKMLDHTAADINSREQVSCEEAWNADQNFVALPWVNNTTGNLQNVARYNSLAHQYHWKTKGDDSDDTEYSEGLSYQIKLIYLVKQVCDALGYDYDFSAWEKSPVWSKLFVMNALPYAWDIKKISAIMPDWTINEFFDELEKLLCMEFEINHHNKTIKCFKSTALISEAGSMEIDEVINEYSVEIAEDSRTKYKGSTNWGYSSGGHQLDKYYSCDWYIKRKTKEDGSLIRNEYNSLESIIGSDLSEDCVRDSNTTGPRGQTPIYPAGNFGLSYARRQDCYFVPKVVKRVKYRKADATHSLDDEDKENYEWGNVCALLPVNQFGNLIQDTDDEDTVEQLNIVPCCIDDTDEERGKVAFLECGETDGENESGSDTHGKLPEHTHVAGDVVLQFGAAYALKEGETASSRVYFDKLHVAFWFGNPASFAPQLPHPWIDNFDTKFTYSAPAPDSEEGVLSVTWDVAYSPYDEASLRLNNSNAIIASHRSQFPKIDPKRKYSFSFLSDEIPNVRGIFTIRGKKYLCEKITANFSTDGISRLLKGEFYRLQD